MFEDEKYAVVEACTVVNGIIVDTLKAYFSDIEDTTGATLTRFECNGNSLAPSKHISIIQQMADISKINW